MYFQENAVCVKILKISLNSENHQRDTPMMFMEHFDKELRKLQRLNPQMPEFSIQRNYLEFMLELPFAGSGNDTIDLKKAQKVLDRDHYGLEKVKERILEHLAVLKLKGDMKSPILCLAGPG